MEEKNIWLIRESEHNVGSINLGPGGMMVLSSRIAWGGEYEQEVRKSSWQSMMRDIELMEELLLQVITRTRSWLWNWVAQRVGKTSSQ